MFTIKRRCYSVAMRPNPTSPLPDLAMSVVLFHSPLEQLRKLLDSLVAAVLRADLAPVALVCVDNSVDQDYALRCQALCDLYQSEILQITVITSTQNKGYGGGHNQALQAVKSRIHLLLNPDVELDAEAMRIAMETLANRQDIALLAPLGLSGTGRNVYLAKDYPSVWGLGVRAFAPQWVKRLSTKSAARYELRDLPADTQLRPIPLASGCCLWVNRAHLDTVQGFDESYFLYFEDYDLSLRLSGYGAVMEHGDIQVIHHGGDAYRKGWSHIYWFISSAVRFFSRWGWRWFG
jgi:GT2 family glycosyltransferase